MYKKILFIFILGYLYSQLGFSASLPNYDKIAITPTTWQEVDLKAYDYIKDKRYPAEIKLLRPISWLKVNHLDKVGNKGNFSLPEFDIKHMYVTVVALKPTKLDTSKINWSKQNSYPVIGTFKRYAPVVKTYIFKDLTTGKISKVTSTPGHKFYVKNRTVNNIIGKNTHYISISRVRSTDILISQTGDKIKLICPINKTSHCGKLYNRYHKPISVYNLEIYNKHRYFVGKNSILVHNGPCSNEAINSDTISSNKIEKMHIVEMNETTSIEKINGNGHIAIATKGLSDCSAVGVCTPNKIILTHLMGSNPEYFDESFIQSIQGLSGDELAEANVIIYSPRTRNVGFIFNPNSAFDDEHFIVQSIGEHLNKYGIPINNVKGYYHYNGSHGFGFFFRSNSSVGFGELDFDDPVIMNKYNNSRDNIWDFSFWDC
ncbi:hypothetical protein [Francisella sp. 19X1-34]|uniref:hypothetical protein n=1 Tax=Francisella sp. 19X1-34 TaxID=3087177 RepID=UPI002E34C0A7|nr:hypothetical protein [Francisella sp. 19X1-34]MED7789690.1 hypothetical protein [Francisella sp. 19X1-34]